MNTAVLSQGLLSMIVGVHTEKPYENLDAKPFKTLNSQSEVKILASAT